MDPPFNPPIDPWICSADNQYKNALLKDGIGAARSTPHGKEFEPLLSLRPQAITPRTADRCRASIGLSDRFPPMYILRSICIICIHASFPFGGV